MFGALQFRTSKYQIIKPENVVPTTTKQTNQKKGIQLNTASCDQNQPFVIPGSYNFYNEFNNQIFPVYSEPERTKSEILSEPDLHSKPRTNLKDVDEYDTIYNYMNTKYQPSMFKNNGCESDDECLKRSRYAKYAFPIIGPIRLQYNFRLMCNDFDGQNDMFLDENITLLQFINSYTAKARLLRYFLHNIINTKQHYESSNFFFNVFYCFLNNQLF
jgi:hypothetical protein